MTALLECEHGYPELKRCPWCKHMMHTDIAPTSPHRPAGDWNTAATHALWELAHSGRGFTSEDLTDMVGFPGTNTANGNNKVGSFIQRNARRMGLRRTDQVKARNPQAHGRWITVWIGRAS